MNCFPFPFGPYFWLLFCPVRPLCYWPKRRLMDKFYCFQANGKNSRCLKKKKIWRPNIKIKFFPQEQLVLLSWFLFAIFDVSVNVASKLLAWTFKDIKVTTSSAHNLPGKIHILVPFFLQYELRIKSRWLVLKQVYHWQLREWAVLF